jgi:hypothetical protein
VVEDVIDNRRDAFCRRGMLREKDSSDLPCFNVVFIARRSVASDA